MPPVLDEDPRRTGHDLLNIYLRVTKGEYKIFGNAGKIPITLTPTYFDYFPKFGTGLARRWDRSTSVLKTRAGDLEVRPVEIVQGLEPHTRVAPRAQEGSDRVSSDDGRS